MGNFKVGQVGKPITHNYTLLDSKGDVVAAGINMMEFVLFIEGKALEESSQYTLVPLDTP